MTKGDDVGILKKTGDGTLELTGVTTNTGGTQVSAERSSTREDHRRDQRHQRALYSMSPRPRADSPADNSTITRQSP
jgi:autotransporter-associated beta strand protein